MPSERPAAVCIGLRKTYFTSTGRVEALSGIDAEFPPAAVTAVAGPSGSGKSSLLRLLAGLDHPSAGTVLVQGRDLGALPAGRIRATRRRVVGYVFQRPSDNFVPHLTLREHLRLAGGGREPVVPVGELMAELSLSDRLDHLPHQLSGGEQQRGALAQILVAGARLVVADEPTAELDAPSSRAVLGVVERLAERGVAFILATHDPGVVRVAHDMVELEDGRVKGTYAEGAPSLGFSHPPETRPAGEPVVDVVGVSKSFRRGPETITAVDEVRFRLHAGELVGVVGRSGSGKTTLLNLVAGWEKPDRGAVVWLQEPPIDPQLPSWSDVAVLPQKFGLLEELTIRENIEYPARLARCVGEARAWIEELTVTLRLDELSDRLPLETSVGQQQRTALARALALHPRLLLADEPTAHQDAASAVAVVHALRRAAATGTSSLVATHNTDFATRLDTVYRITGGRLADASEA